MNMATKVALLGDHSAGVIAHRAIPKALQLAAESLSIDSHADWIHSSQINLKDLSSYNGIWCVPNSPYADAAKVISAIQFARENETPFLGTCGGYQHAVLEYAQNALGHTDADSVEDNPDTSMPLISAMYCALREKPGAIKINNPSQVYSIIKSELIEEQYNCGFGVNAEYLSLFEDTDMTFSGFDSDGDPRIVELNNHPFYIGTAFQPERSALLNNTHALIIAFLEAASKNLQTP